MKRSDTLEDLLHLIAKESNHCSQASEFEVQQAGRKSIEDFLLDKSPLLPVSVVECTSKERSVFSPLSTDNMCHFKFWEYHTSKESQFHINLVPVNPDPHEMVTFSDPVFDKKGQKLVRHVGKARYSDGNDITPNPEKLRSIGVEVSQLNDQIEALHCKTDSKSRQERRRLSSKVCRLRRKANNEANKVKLHLIMKEQAELNEVISRVKRLIQKQQEGCGKVKLSLLAQDIKQRHYKTVAAGNTDQLVEDIIETNNFDVDMP